MNEQNNNRPTEEQGDAADNSQSLSANVARTQNVSTPDTSEGENAQDEAETVASNTYNEAHTPDPAEQNVGDETPADGPTKSITGNENTKNSKKENKKTSGNFYHNSTPFLSIFT